MAGDAFVLWRICCVKRVWSVPWHLGTFSSPDVRTCESGSMAASDGLVPSLPLLLCSSFEYDAGEVGFRWIATDIPLVAIGLRISIGDKKDCEQLLTLTFSSDSVFACITSVLRASSTDQWVCHFKFRQ